MSKRKHGRQQLERQRQRRRRKRLPRTPLHQGMTNTINELSKDQ